MLLAVGIDAVGAALHSAFVAHVALVPGAQPVTCTKPIEYKTGNQGTKPRLLASAINNLRNGNIISQSHLLVSNLLKSDKRVRLDSVCKKLD